MQIWDLKSTSTFIKIDLKFWLNKCCAPLEIFPARNISLNGVGYPSGRVGRSDFPVGSGRCGPVRSVACSNPHLPPHLHPPQMPCKVCPSTTTVPCWPNITATILQWTKCYLVFSHWKVRVRLNRNRNRNRNQNQNRNRNRNRNPNRNRNQNQNHWIWNIVILIVRITIKKLILLWTLGNTSHQIFDYCSFTTELYLSEDSNQT